MKITDINKAMSVCGKHGIKVYYEVLDQYMYYEKKGEKPEIIKKKKVTGKNVDHAVDVSWKHLANKL